MIRKTALIILLVFSLKPAISQELEVINDTIEWTMQSSHGFHFYVQDYIQTLPQNWKSPHNYYNGQFYIRFEIISEATNEPCGLQFGIWQDRINPPPQEKFYSEIMSGIHEMDGPGSVVYSNSSPSAWWSSFEGVDFTRVSDFWRLGINIWSLEPRSVISNSTWGGSDELWATRSKWFPVKVYAVVVAVAQGSTFSGWNNYVNSDAPQYRIDFINETTDKVVASTDEYAYNSGMTNAVTGNGQKLVLVPGQNIYFRTKAHDGLPASGIQNLAVPSRPSKPAFTVNFTTSRTNESVSSSYEYSLSSNMSSVVTGTGQTVSITPGNSIYFRRKATTTQFRSDIQTLVVPAVPAAPQFTIDFVNEKTAATVSNLYLYSLNADLSSPITGTDQLVVLTPGVTMYFQKKATTSSFASAIQTLNIPARPSITGPAQDTVTTFFTINTNFGGAAPVLDADDFTLVNCNITNTGVNTYKVTPAVKGNVEVKIKPDVVSGGNFVSSNFKLYYKSLVSTIDISETDEGITIYPQPASDYVIIRPENENALPLKVNILDMNGREISLFTTSDGIISLTGIDPGTYIIVIETADNEKFAKRLLISR